MGKVMTAEDFIKKARLADSVKTLYVMGGFGAPLNDYNKNRYINNYDYNKNPVRAAMIRNASADTFAFDCICLLKGILWGWNADTTAIYGGAVYCSNGVPDIGPDTMIGMCDGGGSVDFSDIIPGEMLFLPGHAGIYIGDGLAIESTPAWDNGVQITCVGNISKKGKYFYRVWNKHGKLPWIDYSKNPSPKPSDSTFTFTSIKYGSKGSDVKLVQNILRGQGYIGVDGKVLGIDGEVGPNTEKCIKDFQTRQKLISDGIVGPETWRRLFYR